jgi:hypothetical protein
MKLFLTFAVWQSQELKKSIKAIRKFFMPKIASVLGTAGYPSINAFFLIGSRQN